MQYIKQSYIPNYMKRDVIHNFMSSLNNNYSMCSFCQIHDKVTNVMYKVIFLNFHQNM